HFLNAAASPESRLALVGGEKRFGKAAESKQSLETLGRRATMAKGPLDERGHAGGGGTWQPGPLELALRERVQSEVEGPAKEAVAAFLVDIQTRVAGDKDIGRGRLRIEQALE